LELLRCRERSEGGELQIRKQTENKCGLHGVKEDFFFLPPSALSPSQNSVCFRSREERGFCAVNLTFSQILLLVMDGKRKCRKRLLEEGLSSPGSCCRQNLRNRDVRQAGQEKKRLVWVTCAPLLAHREGFPRGLSGG